MGARYLTEEQKKILREKRNKTMLEKYGVCSFTNVNKVKQTKFERYGNANYNNHEKAQQTNLEKYGYKEHNQNPEIKEKISKAKKTLETQQEYENTMLERYGATSPNLVPEIREKYTKTLLANYGVTNPLKIRIYGKNILKQ